MSRRGRVDRRLACARARPRLASRLRPRSRRPRERRARTGGAAARQDLAPDLAAALDASAAAAALWDELAQFYRKASLRWIDATKRSPALRAERIATVVALLEHGVKERR